jgi:hypothetical protein
MRQKKTHTVYIDTKSSKSKNPSNFTVKLNDHFLRNNIKNNNIGAKSEWFLSVKTLAIINSFSNVSKGINDSIILWVAKDDTKGELELGVNDADYNVYEYKIPAGNPNVLDIQSKLNIFLNSYEIECIYQAYDSRFIFKNKELSTDNRKKYLLFKNSYDILGFTENKYYYLNNIDEKEIKGSTAVNLMADRLIKFSIGTGSDFSLKNSNYCNQHIESRLFSDCNMFHLQVVDVLPYELIHYERQCDNLIPIELHGNNINSFQIIATNQDNDDIEVLSDYIMILEFINIKTWDYDFKIYKVIREIYMWIAVFLKNRI